MGISIPNAVATYMAFKFGILIKDKFTDWEAFKLGLIDEKGKLKKKPKTKEEKSALDAVANLARKIKKIIVKYIGDTNIINFLISAMLLKKEDTREEPVVTEINAVIDEDEKIMLEKIIEKLKERGY